ncbi:cytochrome-c oxidase [Methylobacterium durans]|uniref:Cytochrome-c oxidase n=1 Tax=Methylobacterium durans TaxID=2202825 RepID=A0A2U8W4N1_9HYPH|nr:cytochrome-c oxidase [Methylobacterium durans]AWN40322.1 cytochrome-c oxidase [Methylobacterium durans]
MTLVLVYLAALAALSARWLARQRLASKPWLETGAALDLPPGPMRIPAAKLGVSVLLAAIGLLFALLVAAYGMRVPRESWQSLPDPHILWLTTGLLALASLALHGGKGAAERDGRSALMLWLAAALTAMLGFLAGQGLAWRQLLDLGAGPNASAAGAFFYLITALHALHVGGGLVALCAITARAATAPGTEASRLGVGLCALYADALLGVWLVLFGLLFRTPWSGWIYALCGPA